MSPPAISHDPLLFGSASDEGIVALEHVKHAAGDEMALFVRESGRCVSHREPFQPFIVATESAWSGCPVASEFVSLAGKGELNTLARFKTWRHCLDAKKWLSASSPRGSYGGPAAPFLFVSDPAQQYLMLSRKTCFMGMAFEDLRRLQVDIECFTGGGYDFCSAERECDRIIMIAMSDQSGWSTVLSGGEMDEAALLSAFVDTIRERDPDIIEGHNLFNFDLPYIAARAERHGVKLAIGRDGSEPRKRPSRFNAGERTINFTRFEVYGRSIVDSLFLVQSYDVSHRALDGYGLKAVAVHFGVAADDRTYIEGDQISEVFLNAPDRLADYARDDVLETERIASLLSRSSFVQAQMLPFSYQNVCVRGNAVKIDALLMREYLQQRQAIPLPAQGRTFAGGYTDMFAEGVISNVHHCDVRSLYPSLMLTQHIEPASDSLGVFLKALRTLRTFRVETKRDMQVCEEGSEKLRLDALQSAFKILINSFYGYLGFSQGHFNDFDAADKVTSEGRSLLRAMIESLREQGAEPIEIDTDGIYFVPPPVAGSDAELASGMTAFREAFAATLPPGIEIEFDGEYVSMYSYKMKNYALLSADGEMIIKGAALKSRGLERYQREFLREMIRMKLEGREDALPALRQRYDDAIARRNWSVDAFSKTENLQTSPDAYAANRSKGKGSRRAAYELALAASREYKMGDQVAYYVTGEKKNVAVHENSKLVSDWDPDHRDENTAYYRAKLDALYTKLGGPEGDARQGELF
ncbi:MAG: DNA polymerase II [Verrucomicrobia bacterium]|nr:DNA polymerase II [Verrucomicrobiota bacterium]